MSALIISIGNELLNGRTVNTNATFIAEKLHSIGIAVDEIITVGDDARAIKDALDRALRKVDIIIITGGLGPTHDDITKKAVAEYFGKDLILDEELLESIRQRFLQRGSEMPSTNRNQALVPEGAELIPNSIGTAPGILIKEKGKFIFLLPGVPREMQEMVRQYILPLLEKNLNLTTIYTVTYRTTGIAESRIYEICQDIFEKYPGFEIAFLPKSTGVDIRLLVKKEGAVNQLPEFEAALKERIGKFIYAIGEKEIEEVVGELLRDRKLTLSVAESCTGGLVQDRITNVPGSSDYFMGGMVTYSNQSKEKFLGVRRESLEKYGAVSEQVAREMAEGVRRSFDTHLAISTTGIAGPTGATPEKPVGLIFVGLTDGEHTYVRKFIFGRDRRLNKERGAQAAIEMLRRYLLGIPLEKSSSP